MPKPSHPRFRVGQNIPSSGIYRVFHRGHREAHEVTLLAGEVFPRCSKCGTDVQFSLTEAAPTLESQSGFRVRLYEIPHPEETPKPLR